MMVDGLRNYKFYIDLYEDTEFIISPTKNNSGIIYTDENGDYFNNKDKGVQVLKACTSYSYSDSILLYNQTEYCIVDGTFDNYSKDFKIYKNENIKYKLGGIELYTNSMINLSTVSSYIYKFEIDLSLYNVYKCFLNGNEIKSFTFSATGVYITGVDTFLINNFTENDLIIVAYTKNQTVVGTTTFVYDSVKSISYSDIIDNCDYTQFQNMYKINNFQDGYDSTQTKSLYQYKDNFSYTSVDIVNDITNKLNIRMYETESIDDIRQYTRKGKFRLIGFNPYSNKMKIYTNCRVTSGVQENIENLNVKTISIDYDEKLDISLNNMIAYGEEEYGVNYYGGFSILADSEVI